MTEPIDYSDRLAKVRVHLEILRDRAPGGKWESNAVVKKWQRNHYSLTLREFKRLEEFLAQEVARETSPKYNQPTLFGGVEPHVS